MRSELHSTQFRRRYGGTSNSNTTFPFPEIELWKLSSGLLAQQKHILKIYCLDYVGKSQRVFFSRRHGNLLQNNWYFKSHRCAKDREVKFAQQKEQNQSTGNENIIAITQVEWMIYRNQSSSIWILRKLVQSFEQLNGIEWRKRIVHLKTLCVSDNLINKKPHKCIMEETPKR